MSTSERHLPTRELVFSILFIAVILLISGFTYIQGDLSTYIATPMAIADQELFTNDFSIQAFKQPNAQSVSDNLIALFLKLGVSWQAVSVVGFLLTFAIFAAGIIAIARELTGGKSYWLVSSLLMLFALYAVSGLRIGRNPIWYNSFYYAQMGFCLAIWGFYFSLKKRWYTAFILFGIATLLHFTVGSYSAGFMVPFILYDVFKHKKYKQLPAILIWVACAVGIYIMMALGGSTSTGLLSSDAFIKIHCHLRHPHHHIPSSWEMSEWINFACYIAGTGLFLLMGLKKDDKRQSLMVFYLVTTAMTALILLANYIFIELIPVAFVGKLQPARSVFIYRFFLAALLSYVIYRFWQQRLYFHAALAAFFITIPRMFELTLSGVLLLIFGVLFLARQWGSRRENKVAPYICDLLSVLMVMVILWVSGANIFIVVTMFTILCVLILMSMATMYFRLSDDSHQRKLMAAIMIVATLMIVLFPWIDVQGQFEHFALKRPESRYTLVDVNHDAKALALRFKESSPKDALFFGNPYDITTSYFRLFSERSVVVAFKNMPFTDQGLREWVDRLTNMGALSINRKGYYVKHQKAFWEMTPQEMLDYAQRYSATHLLISLSGDEQVAYLNAGFTVHDKQGSWIVFEVPDTSPK